MKYIQNRTNWCWVAACKVAGEQYKKNFTEMAFTLESPETEVAVSNLDGLRTDIVKRRNGIYFVDAWQSAIARNADFLHGGLEGNFPGNDQMKMRGLKYVVLGDCESNLIQTITLGTYDSAHSLLHDYCRQIESVFERHGCLIGNAILYPGGICHSFVALDWKKNGELVIYDPWDGNIGTYTIDEAFYTGFLSAQGKGILKWVQYIV